MNLFKSKNFLPLFITQFLGALNDNLLKNALVMLITYKLASNENAQFLVTIATALFILPYFLFSAMAGQFADKLDRGSLARIIKLAEILIMILAAIGFYTGNSWFLIFVLFCMGTHSTFFSPIKYALLPQHLSENELLKGNSYVEAGTFLAILLGTILGGVIVMQNGGEISISIALILVAVAGYFSSVYIPPAPAPDPSLKVSYNIWSETKEIIEYSKHNHKNYLSILAISWFWAIGATYLTNFPSLAKDYLSADETVVTLFLASFSIGIGIGSLLCNKLLRGAIQATYVPVAIIGISIFTLLLYMHTNGSPANSENLINIWQFLATANGIKISLDLLMIAICSGLFIVPLYAMLQHNSEPAHVARVIAANNVINAIYMVGASVLNLILLKLSLTIPQIFLVMAILNGFVAIYICKLLPDALMRSIARFILRIFYHVDVKGMENFNRAGEKVLLVANHTSFLDAAIIAAYLPEKVKFAVNTHIANRWWMKPLLALVDAFPLDPTNPMATKGMIDEIKKNRKCMIFPEGRITVTGSLMKVYEGPGMIADKSEAKILPIRIEGAQYSPLSRLKGKVRIRLFPKISMIILEPYEFKISNEIKGRKRRQIAGNNLYDLMTGMMFESSDYRQTLFSSLINAMQVHGNKHTIAEDIERKPLNYKQFISRAFGMGSILSRQTKGQKIVGVLLPTSIGCSLTFFGLQAYGKIPAMLNFSAGSSSILTACKAAEVKQIITSKKFIEAGKLEELIADISASGIEFKYLEDLARKISINDKLKAVYGAIFPESLYNHTRCKAVPDDIAYILFTSGSEGTPKGVALSHVNVQANRFQLASCIDFGPSDKVFNCLPMFHAFGMTGGTLLPILSGIKSFYYPSPLHYRIIPELIYDTNSTIMFGTDTFLANYARFAHAYDFYSLRYIFAGAEKLKEETRKTYSEKFGVRIFEAYGATETSPALSTNSPMHNKLGSVGRILPGISYRLEKVPGIEEGGQLFVKGPNIMKGYFKSEKPGIIQPPEDGWYDTGDVVAIDDEGYVSIKGRTKRFAKIAGEMVSLTTVETALEKIWPGFGHAVVAVPDDKKGEQLILLTTNKEAERSKISEYFRDNKISELSVPRKIMFMESIPLLGTGKTDYVKAKQIALEQIVS